MEVPVLPVVGSGSKVVAGTPVVGSTVNSGIGDVLGFSRVTSRICVVAAGGTITNTICDMKQYEYGCHVNCRLMVLCTLIKPLKAFKSLDNDKDNSRASHHSGKIMAEPVRAKPLFSQNSVKY